VKSPAHTDYALEDPHDIVHAYQRGLIARALFQCVALSPPLISTRADVDRMVGIRQSVWPAAERRVLEAAA
jgi:adenosylmethionine-8-amino-7-oxononanoate aminotransferase